jgi:hypothetical protein
MTNGLEPDVIVGALGNEAGQIASVVNDFERKRLSAARTLSDAFVLEEQPYRMHQYGVAARRRFVRPPILWYREGTIGARAGSDCCIDQSIALAERPTPIAIGGSVRWRFGGCLGMRLLSRRTGIGFARDGVRGDAL